MKDKECRKAWHENDEEKAIREHLGHAEINWRSLANTIINLLDPERHPATTGITPQTMGKMTGNLGGLANRIDIKEATKPGEGCVVAGKANFDNGKVISVTPEGIIRTVKEALEQRGFVEGEHGWTKKKEKGSPGHDWNVKGGGAGREEIEGWGWGSPGEVRQERSL